MFHQIPSNVDFGVYSPLIEYVKSLALSGGKATIGIDCRCASGKTTLSALLEGQFGCTVIHIDDFFLRPSQRTRERLAAPGGNIDYERFLSEVLVPLSKREPFSYRPYDCSTASLGEPVPVVPSPICVVEGSYSLHPNFDQFYDLRVFLTLNKEEQLKRLLKRSGPEKLKRFQNEWIPMEEKYFDFFKIQEKCDFVFNSGI